MSENDSTTPTPRRRGRWLRRLVRLGLLLVALLLLLGWWGTRPARLTPLVTAVIERATGLEASIGHATLRWPGRLELDEVSLTLPDQPPGPDRLFDAEHVLIDADLGELLTGRVAAHSIVLLQPSLYLTENVDTGRFNLHHIPGGDGPGEFPLHLPEVFLHEGAIRFGEVSDGHYETIGALEIDGTLTESTQAPGHYAFVLRQENPTGESPPVLRGEIQLGEFFVARAELEHFSIDHPQRNLLPRRVREWWDRLDPQGTLPRVEVGFDADPAVGLRAVLELAHGGLTLPYGDFASRMTDVSGRFVLHNDTIRIENLTGLVEGVRYTIGGQIQGFETDAAFDLSATTEPFTIEANPAFVQFLPPKVRKHYDRFSPSGEFRVTANIRRPERGGVVQYAGRLEVLNARGQYRKFPYPLRDVTGAIVFSEEKVEIVQLRGESPSGGTITIRGAITPPGNGAAVDVTVVADGIAVDGHLLNAMEPKHRKVMDLFLNQQRYDELVARGVVRPPTAGDVPAGDAGDAAEASDAPVFALGGRIDAHIHIDRPFGDDQRYDVTTTIDTAGAGMLLEHWPYPMTSAGGTITVAPDAVIVDGVQARGVTGGSALISGRVDRPTKNELFPDIRLDDVRLPADDVLLASLPAPQDAWVARLGLRGVLAGDGAVFRRDDGEIDFRLRGSLADAAAAPLGPDHPLAGFTGSFTLTRETLALDRLAGRSDATTLTLSGSLDWSKKEAARDAGRPPIAADIRLSGVNLEIGPHLLDLVPEGHPALSRLQTLLADYRPTGVFNGELDYRSAPGAGPERFTLTLQPHRLAFDFRGRRVAFEEITGVAVVHPDRVELDDLHARFDRGAAGIAGRIPFASDASPALRITAEGAGVDDTMRTLLPEAVVAVIDGLEVRGGYRMTSSLVERSVPAAAGDISGSAAGPGRELIFDGLIELTDASAEVGVPIRGLAGTLQVSAVKRPNARWPDLDLRLQADRVHVADRLVSPLTMRLATGDRPDLLEMREMVGSVYGGTLVGKGTILLEDPGAYQFDFTLQDVAVEPMLNPDAPAELVAAAPGTLSASLAIEGLPGKPQTRSGRGALEIRDAALLKRPIAMAVLQAANLSLPVGGAFDRASARYLLDGDTVRFDALRFESPSVAILGAGTMDYKTLGLDLNMVTRNPGAPHLGPISDMIHLFKDELIAIHVTGPLGDPDARLVSFETIRNSIAQVIGGGGLVPAPVEPQTAAEPSN